MNVAQLFRNVKNDAPGKSLKIVEFLDVESGDRYEILSVIYDEENDRVFLQGQLVAE